MLFSSNAPITDTFQIDLAAQNGPYNFKYTFPWDPAPIIINFAQLNGMEHVELASVTERLKKNGT